MVIFLFEVDCVLVLIQRRLVIKGLVAERAGELVSGVSADMLGEVVLLVELLGAVVALEGFGLVLVLLEGLAGEEVAADAADDEVRVPVLRLRPTGLQEPRGQHTRSRTKILFINQSK